MGARSLGCALLLSGCSWIFVEGPPEHAPRDQPVDCTRNVGVPVLDVVLASLSGTLMLSAASEANGDQHYDMQQRDSAKVAIPIFAALGVVETIAAWWGFREVKRCTEANTEVEINRRLRLMIAPQPAAPPSMAPAVVPPPPPEPPPPLPEPIPPG